MEYEMTITVNGQKLDIFKEKDLGIPAIDKYNKERYVLLEGAIKAFGFNHTSFKSLMYLDEGLQAGIVGEYMNVGLLRSLLFAFTSLATLDEFDRQIGVKR